MTETKSSVVAKRSMVVEGAKTSVSLEDSFWEALKEVARDEKETLSERVSKIRQAIPEGNLSSAIRVWLLRFYRQRASRPAT